MDLTPGVIRIQNFFPIPQVFLVPFLPAPGQAFYFRFDEGFRRCFLRLDPRWPTGMGFFPNQWCRWFDRTRLIGYHLFDIGLNGCFLLFDTFGAIRTYRAV